jgi:hypothetical protein
MSLDEHVSRLKFFNQKAEKLRRLSFTQNVFTQPPAVTATFLLEPPSAEIQTTTPHEESIDAFLYTFRFFIMGNEETSFRRMPQMYEQLPITEEKKQQLRSGKDKLNHWLDSLTYFQIDDKALTNRHILETFINGGLGHANDKERVKEYEMWAATPIHPFLKVEFIYIIAKIFEWVCYFRGLHEVILEELEPSTVRGQ